MIVTSMNLPMPSMWTVIQPIHGMRMLTWMPSYQHIEGGTFFHPTDHARRSQLHLSSIITNGFWFASWMSQVIHCISWQKNKTWSHGINGMASTTMVIYADSIAGNARMPPPLQ